MLYLKLIGIIFFVAILYCFVILLIQYNKKVGTSEARKKLCNFIRDCFCTPVVTYYPVDIGIDEYKRPHADIIEREFEDLHKIYEQFYLADFYICNDIIHYKCKVDTPQKELSEKDLIKYLEALFDNIFHRFMHRTLPDHAHVSNLVAIHIQEGFLSIFVARNKKGTQNIFEQKKKERSFYNKSKAKMDLSIEENWDE